MNDENQSPLSPNSPNIEPSKDFKKAMENGPVNPSEYQMPAWMKIAILVGVVLLASVGYFTSMRNQPPPLRPLNAEQGDAEELASRQPVPDFILTEENGTQKKLSDFRGNVVILSFWASWCGPCLTELPTFAEMEKKFREKGLKVVPVNVDDGDDGKVFAKEFWAKKSIAFPSYFDTTKDIAQQFEVNMLPSNFIIDRQGRMVFSSAGASDWSAPETLSLIESVLQEPTAPASAGTPAGS